jgi:hypothetical protein
MKAMHFKRLIGLKADMNIGVSCSWYEVVCHTLTGRIKAGIDDTRRGWEKKKARGNLPPAFF